MIHIKKSNFDIIHNFAMNGDFSIIQGVKLFALMKLVEDKGEPIESNDSKWTGVKAYEYGKGLYIGFRKAVFPNGSFVLNTLTLEAN